MILFFTGGICFLVGSVLLKTKKMPDWLSFIGVFFTPLWIVLESILEFRDQTFQSCLILVGLLQIILGFCII